jgi:hypothetical protein
LNFHVIAVAFFARLNLRIFLIVVFALMFASGRRMLTDILFILNTVRPRASLPLSALHHVNHSVSGAFIFTLPLYAMAMVARSLP